MTDKPFYKCDGLDDNNLLEDHIKDSGLYWRHRLKCWQVWYVDEENNKSIVGTCDESLGEVGAKMMWNEFVYLATNKISGVDEIVPKGEIH